MIVTSQFQSAFPFPSGHLETIIPYFFRKAPILDYVRDRIELDGGDFLDLDWLKNNNKKLVIISHGLEGSSDSTHIKGQAKHLHQNGFDVLAWNCRGCSGEVNRLKRSYHSGVSEDLSSVIEHTLQKNYTEIYLLGHSMGGNITLKYLGEKKDDLSQKIKGAVAISTPLCLASSSSSLAKGFSKFYTRHFISSLVEKIREKSEIFDDFNYDIDSIKKFFSFEQFDDLLTAPLHGFSNAKDYWEKCSTYSIVSDIACPTLIINAKNDPFLAGNCYPVDQLKNIPHLLLEMPERGVHIGFVQPSGENKYWNELRTLEFFNEY